MSLKITRSALRFSSEGFQLHLWNSQINHAQGPSTHKTVSSRSFHFSCSPTRHRPEITEYFFLRTWCWSTINSTTMSCSKDSLPSWCRFSLSKICCRWDDFSAWLKKEIDEVNFEEISRPTSFDSCTRLFSYIYTLKLHVSGNPLSFFKLMTSIFRSEWTRQALCSQGTTVA